MVATVVGLSLLAGFILPFAAVMVIGSGAGVSERAVGILLFAVIGLLFYLAVRTWRKYEEWKKGKE